MTDAAKDAFVDALEVMPAQRRAFLEDRLGDDPPALARAVALLDAHERADQFMAAPTIATPSRTPETVGASLVGTSLGPYRLEEVIGEGGFGVVFRASQATPVERTVAIKVIKPGMTSAASVARVDAERELLARMDHPNIAKILDAGATPDGRPYFVMEHVDGSPITAYCSQRRLPVAERLELVRRACLAVQHAHHKGVIHRDIKPSNVLVTEVDGKPEPRVIDFGIAKVIEEPGDDVTRLTVTGHFAGTPAYMSPEQIASPASIDTRSDTYALGALLYEIVTDNAPFDHKRVREASIALLARIICEEEPPKPSTRYLRATDATDTGPRRLPPGFRNELDWIILKAMAKEPERRYHAA
ncbi:MAG: serine/threonine protein kinase, partial [Phycisphaerae bacterium]|nr:serine/threonine protein kinase [Phycisphaerae bacterium]